MHKKNNTKIVVLSGTFTTWGRDKVRQDGEYNEIISAGISVINTNDFSIDCFTDVFDIKPETCEVSEYCTQKTGVTQSRVNKGIKFRDFCEILENKFKTRDLCWATFGDYTRKVIYRQCAIRDIWDSRYPFGDRHINIKSLFNLSINPHFDYNLKGCLNFLGHTFKGEYQNISDIAFNQARILSSILTVLRENKKQISKNIGGIS